MILADKIINERKKCGWSQEELAEKLGVSRQSVSKWEGAQAIPDIQKLLKMAEIFGVSTDYLLKDEMEPEDIAGKDLALSLAMEDSERPCRKVTMEEANDFLGFVKKSSSTLANNVSICILSPAVLILLAGFAESNLWGLTENIAILTGLIVLLGMVAYAVFRFIFFGMNYSQYDYLYKDIFETEYGVTGMVKEKNKDFQPTFMAFIATGVVLCILSVIPLIVCSLLEAPDYVICTTVSVLLVIVAAAVNLFVRAGFVDNSYKVLLQEQDYDVRQKKANKEDSLRQRIYSAYWMITTAVFLCYSFLTSKWGESWIIWPIAAFIFLAVMAITKVFVRDEK